jgi:hypothetical protein
LNTAPVAGLLTPASVVVIHSPSVVRSSIPSGASVTNSMFRDSHEYDLPRLPPHDRQHNSHPTTAAATRTNPPAPMPIHRPSVGPACLPDQPSDPMDEESLSSFDPAIPLVVDRGPATPPLSPRLRLPVAAANVCERVLAEKSVISNSHSERLCSGDFGTVDAGDSGKNDERDCVADE